MARSTHPLALSGLLASGLVCACAHATPAASPSIAAPEDSPAQAHPEREIEPSCRALVNLEDGFLDVQVREGKVSVGRRTGTALYDGLTVSVAQVEPFGGGDWVGANLVRIGPDGRAEVWLSADPGERPDAEEFCDEPDPDDPDAEPECWMDPADFYADHSIEILGAFGPYLSIGVSEYGFAGGAHEYDEGGFRTLALAGIDPLDGSALGPAHVSLARRIVAEELIGDDGFRPEEAPSFESPEDFGEFAVVIGPREVENVATTAGALAGEEPEWVESLPHFLLRVEAGDWATNHGYVELAIDLTPVPELLADHVPEGDRYVHPAGCVAISLDARAVLLPSGTQWVPAHEIDGAIIGVTWIAPSQNRVPGLDDVRN